MKWPTDRMSRCQVVFAQMKQDGGQVSFVLMFCFVFPSFSFLLSLFFLCFLVLTVSSTQQASQR